jgi:hypothetical protein
MTNRRFELSDDEWDLLIAAAPDMLKALQSIMTNVSPGGFDDIRRLDEAQLVRIRELARAAIAKAEGRS